MRRVLQAGECVRDAGRRGFGIEDVIRLIFSGFVVDGSEELFGELDFAHRGGAAGLFEALEGGEEGGGCQIGLVVGGLV